VTPDRPAAAATASEPDPKPAPSARALVKLFTRASAEAATCKRGGLG
jgi:hypothetical protein